MPSCRPARLVPFLVLLPVLLVLPATGLPASAGARPGIDKESVDVRLPSSGAGGGTLALRIHYPAHVEDYRFPDGAPVAIYLPGAMKTGNLDSGLRLVDAGFVLIDFLYPGGVDGPIRSDGRYDYRGDLCQQAVRDVILFAGGYLADEEGRTIDEIVPGPVHPGLVGLAPYSNGLIGLITLDRYGDEIPFTPFQAGWENPSNAQLVAVDVGSTKLDCDPQADADGNGLPRDDARNPWYDPETGYGPLELAVDYERLAFDPLASEVYEDAAGVCPPVIVSGTVLLDGNGNGRLDGRPGDPGCHDLDGDGMLGRDEDFPFRAHSTFDEHCGVTVIYSPQVTRALRDRGALDPEDWPAWLATPEESAAYWALRSAAEHLAGVTARFPDMPVIEVYTRQDHVQSQEDHPHVRQLLDGFLGGGNWFRLNADAGYYAAENGGLPPGYVETPAGEAVPKGELKDHGEPVGTRNEDMGAAALAELADRIHCGCFWPDLDGTLRPTGPVAPDVTGLAFGPDGRTLSWDPAEGAFCYDVLRGDVTGLARNGDAISLGEATCLEEDSPDERTDDPEAPAPGQAWYYLARPNGLHGSWGEGSDGTARRDTSRACRH